MKSATIFSAIWLSILLMASSIAVAGSLTASEIQQIESDLGITLSPQEIDDLGAIVKPDSIPAWRSAAEARIDTHRKSDLSVLVEDANGNPVPGVQVEVNLRKNAFKFGGVANAVDYTDAGNNLAAQGQTTAYWKQVTTNLFNAIGFNNAFKPKITSQHQYIPAITNWASANNLDMRAHLLIWPGGGDLADLSGTPGVDYGDHLSRSSTSAYASTNVLGAVETYANSAQNQPAKNALKAVVDAEISEWAGRWDVYEWDVINETRGNNLLQQILGYDEEAEWFNIASNNMVNPEAKLFINENQIISAKSEGLQSGYYATRRDIYYTTIDRLIANGAPIHGIGFQNRYKWERLEPADVYNRLDEFGNRYGLQMAGTEFEIKDQSPFIPGEYLRAQMTEETLTVYYSHALAVGLNAWDYMEGDISSLCYYDGTIKLNGLVWYYVHRIRYNTQADETTDSYGETTVSGYEGDYDITVTYAGTEYPASVTLTSNQTVVVELDVVVVPSENTPVFTLDPISKPNATQDTDYTGESIANSATDADGDPLTYTKVQGPSWLSIAESGDLSGTPSGSDAGQNSWLVQVSDGVHTDTAVLKIFVNGTGSGGYTGITVVDTDSGSDSSSTGPISIALSTAVSAQVGDKIVVVASTNKKGDVQPLTLAQIGGTGAAGPQTEHHNLTSTYPTSWGWYMTVTTTGTFSYAVSGSSITAGATLHLLRGDAGQVGFEDYATWDDPDNADNGTSYALDYTFGGTLTDGVVIEAVSARTDLITEPGSYTEDFNGQNKRINAHFDGVTGSSLTSTYSLSGGTLDKQTSGALGMVFAGVGSGGGNTPPVFSSDPINEAGATEGTDYTGHTLADHALDGDFDAMTYGIISGPAWLILTPSTGELSGTPLAGDLGANSWKVSVTDGIATNYATLQINVGSPLPPPVSPQNGTNILFIAIDDMKPLLGCYGDPLAISPNIDSLADAGVTFMNAQSQWAVCGPSRASISTGLYPEEILPGGFDKMRGDAVDPGRVNGIVRPNVVTMQQWFRYNGYRTAAAGKINDPRCVGSMDTVTGKVAEDGNAVDDPPSWGDPVDPNSLPIDFFSNSAYVPHSAGWSPAGKPSVGSNSAPDSAFTDGVICDQGITLMQSLSAGDTQFFLGVGFKKPHLPFVAPQQYWDVYDRNDIEIHPFQDHPLHEVTYSWKYATELVGYDDIDDVRDANGLLLVPEAKQRELIHGYYACASFIDAQIGRLLTELETLGLHTNTIVVVWGDHGFHLGDHAEWAKHTNLEQAARVPLVIYSPFTGVAGAQTQSPVNLVDMYPTLCDLAGLPAPEQPLTEGEGAFDPASGRAIKGMSLVPVMQDPAASVRTGALTLFSRNGAMGYAYRTERYRYIEWIDGGAVVARELYDYELDPMETVNLSAEPGFDALMLQYSQTMRAEMDALGLSGSDIACIKLQGSPFYDTTGGNLVIPGLKSSRNGSDFQIEWPDAAGQTYNLMMKTNLLDAVWQNEQTGLTNGVVIVPADKDEAFYQIELD